MFNDTKHLDQAAWSEVRKDFWFSRSRKFNQKLFAALSYTKAVLSCRKRDLYGVWSWPEPNGRVDSSTGIIP